MLYICYVENFVLESGEIATADVCHLASDLEDVGGCQITDESCRHSEVVVTWTVQNLSQAFCAYELKGICCANVGYKHVLLNDLQLAFSHTQLNPDLPSPRPPSMHCSWTR